MAGHGRRRRARVGYCVRVQFDQHPQSGEAGTGDGISRVTALGKSGGEIMTNAVNARSVSKWFGEGETRVQALRSLDLEIRMGELSMLMGPSGCGKTTLVSVIAGLL